MSKGPLKQDFLDIYVTTISESIILEVQNISTSSFLSKYLKFNLDFKNAVNTFEKCFVFEIIASELVLLNCLY